MLRPLLASGSVWKMESDASLNAGREFSFEELTAVVERWVEEAAGRPRGSVTRFDEFLPASSHRSSLS